MTTNPNYNSEQRGFYEQQYPQNYPAPQGQQPPYPNQVPVYQNAPQQPYPQAQYSQPVVVQPQAVPTAIIVNQPVVHQNIKVRTEPINTVCPFCRAQITTIAQTELNFKACCVCVITCWICFACIQMANDKDCSCYDCIHTCPNCGQTIGHYYAM